MQRKQISLSSVNQKDGERGIKKKRGRKNDGKLIDLSAH